MLPIEDFADLTIVKDESKNKQRGKSRKERKGNKRKASLLSDDQTDQESTNDFPISTTASTQPIRSRRRTSNVPPTVQIEKPSKRRDSDDESAEEQRFESLIDSNIEDTVTTFAQPIEKLSLHEEPSNENCNSMKHSKNITDIKECQFIDQHKAMELLGLKEETDNNFLNADQIMEGIICSKCGLRLVKSDLSEQNKDSVTVFNARNTVLCCEELLTSGPVVCRFCICHNCKMSLFQKEENHSKGRISRRRRNINK